MKTRHAPGWQLILADLALILFLVTLSALVSETSEEPAAVASATARSGEPAIAPSQALFRSTQGGPSLANWLAERPIDPRATLTIFAQHSGSDVSEVWAQAQALSREAAGQQFNVRVMITRGDTSDVYASLAYDAPPQAAAGD